MMLIHSVQCYCQRKRETSFRLLSTEFITEVLRLILCCIRSLDDDEYIIFTACAHAVFCFESVCQQIN